MLLKLYSPSFFLTFFLLSKPALQVDVEFSRFYTVMWLVKCRNIQPGVCCRPPITLRLQPTIRRFNQVTIQDLGPSDIASVWSTAIWTGGCHGPSRVTHPGPSIYWSWFLPGQLDVLTGASYIRLEFAPPETHTQSKWLSTQGIRALAWNGGHMWTADSMLALEPGSRNARVSRKSRIQKRSKHQWVQHGTAYITDPPREKYADLISINGTDYTDDGRGDMVYRDERGRALDLSSFGA